jgi:acetyl esterase/lipase
MLLGATAVGLTACTAKTQTTQSTEPTAPQTISYGDALRQVADLTVPAGTPPDHGWPVVILVHGGYWSADYTMSLENDVAADLVTRGFATWNIDYRSLGNGGGYPTTFDDVAAACDHLETLAGQHALDTTRTAIVGHSAGGTLALWAAARHKGITAAVTQAGVNDLRTAADQHLGAGAVTRLLGGTPQQVPDRYAQASPQERLPIGVPMLAICGSVDTTVPVSQTTNFAKAAEKQRDQIDVQVIPGETHFDCLSPKSGIWAATAAWLQDHVR